MIQEFKSAKTSINANKVPAIFRKLPWAKAKLDCQDRFINVDIGGGKYDTATEYLSKFGIENLIFDPYNRDFKHNLRVVMEVAVEPANTATISNVLNVIKEREKRLEILRTAKRWSRTVFIKVHEGDKSGIGKQTKAGCWQENRRTTDYIAEVLEVFPDVSIKNGIIVAYSH